MENIELIQNTAVEAAGKRLLSATNLPRAVIVDGDQEVKSLEHLQPGRHRFRGQMTTNVMADFCAYVKGVAGDKAVPGFVNVQGMTAKVFFNLGSETAPGHGDWTATLGLQPTAAYKALQEAAGRRFDQAGLIDWIEDWNDVLVADFTEGNASLTRAIAAVRKLKISTKSEATHTTQDFSASRSALEEVEASGADVLPVGFRLATEPYDGLTSRSFSLKLSVLTGGDKPALTLRWLRKEQQLEQIAREFKSVLVEQLGPSATLAIGAFELGK
ncbi:Uncharacterized conserved protein YfdQ, DUF2303 family [Dyella jiangningensis]|uniref:DUF2303 family protein n=1 Tax=Dyella sp. AtDHG13 TaxID=1938897 RepID=UPI0008880C74|nr:DUF2303 family protein [Dyella sp. AtDHG13]PXV60697.1 uncharacterized protein YfdQ (DUF2303 family) [Dyella sp. AtDHG13]SDJ55565.1 Uncharacterized conserved protein YfdQ, DUF2303 family [Dyella jiangningensis]